MANKTISELSNYVGVIQGDEILIISKKNEFGEYESKQYKVCDLADEVSSSVVMVVSSDVSSFIAQTSSMISNLTADCSTAISIVSDTSAVISNFLSSISATVSNDLCTFVFTEIEPLRYVVGLSTLNYYTYIGDDINKLSDEVEKYPDLAKISTDVIWFDTRDEVKNTPRNITRIDNLQYQVYKLGLQVNELQRIQTYGVIPGDVENTIKDKLIQISEDMEIPRELQKSMTMEGIDIYGHSLMRKGTKYYTVFVPAGFEYDKKNTKMLWKLEDHDYGNDLVQTFTKTDGEKFYGLKVEMKPFNSESYTSSVVYYADMSACVDDAGTAVHEWVQENAIIDQAIDGISAVTGKAIEVKMSISTDYFDEELQQYIEMEEPLYADVHKCADVASDYSLSIIGEDYLNDYTYYCVKFNDSVRNLPLVTDVTWKFISNTGELCDTFEYDIYDHATGEIKPDAKATVSFINKNEMVCFPHFQYQNCTITDLADYQLSLYVHSNYDPTLSVARAFNIGGQGIRGQEKTVFANCAKVDNEANFQDKTDSLYKGELLYYADKKQLAIYDGDGVFNVVGSGGGGTGITKEVLEDLELDHLTFATGSALKAQVKVDGDGNVKVVRAKSQPEPAVIDAPSNPNGVGGVYVNHLLQIGKVFCGGTSAGYTDCIASHSFVELVNASEQDIDLQGMYLMYRTSRWDNELSDYAPPSYKQPNGDKWEFLKLEGIIKARGTFVIRGAKCNIGKNAVLQIDKYDMEWRRKTNTDFDGFTESASYKRSGDPIIFDQVESSFYLVIGMDEGGIKKGNIQQIVKSYNNYIWDSAHTDAGNTDLTKGYIDLASVGTSPNAMYSEGTNAKIDMSGSQLDPSYLLYIKYYYMDPSKQGNKHFSARSTKNLWTFINFKKYNENKGNYKQPYYGNDLKMRSAPHASFDSGSIFSNKTQFSEQHPNMINVTFGMQATYKNNSCKASRCFNWISIGEHDEFLRYRKAGTSEWTTKYSISDASAIEDFYEKTTDKALIEALEALKSNYYTRLHWTASNGQTVTTHKCILHNALDAGEYEYYIGRDGDVSYKSEERKFTVHSDAQASNFSFIQTTDQQGFNWLEYQAWKSACSHIKSVEAPFNFTINTGDIAQSGNRVSEWLDYYDGRSAFVDKEEMFSIGNNDLCGKKICQIGDGNDNTSKFNLINSLYYYTFELDPRNAFCFAEYGTPAKKYPLYSLYSFNYGKWHFVSLVSEIRPEYSRAFDGLAEDDRVFAEKLNARVESWFTKDLQLARGTTDLFERCENTIVYMHEMPFTILARNSYWQDADDPSGTAVPVPVASPKRTGGCKLNDYNDNGTFRFSRLFRKYGIRLVFGGHKHTFSISKPVYDAPALASYLQPGTNKLTSDNYLTSDAFMGTMSNADSIKPVVEVLKSYEVDDSYWRSEVSSHVRYVAVDRIKAPVYVMSQATGYKCVSNKESSMPVSADNGSEIPFLLSYFPGTYGKKASNHNTEENKAQHRPMYIRYDFHSTALGGQITVTAKQVDNVYKNKASDEAWGKRNQPSTYNINNQYNGDLSAVEMTFGVNTLDRVGDPQYKTHGWYEPRVSTIKKSYEDMMDGNHYKLDCMFEM